MQQDYIALDWVKSEIDETLSMARQSLEAYVEDVSDPAQLRFCLAYIHQISGSLQVVEFFGAALLCEEMEHYCNDLISGKLEASDANLSLLMQGLLQLSPYLEQVKASRHDVPNILLPLINDYRVARKEPLVSDAAFFNPDVSVLYSRLPSLDYRKFDDPKFIELLRKLRQMFQFALVGILRGDDLEKNWEYSTKVYGRLAQVTRGTAAGQGIYIALAFIEGLSKGVIPLTSATKKLMKQLDDVVRFISSGRSAVLKKPVDYELLRGILYHLAEAKVEGGKIASILKTLKIARRGPASGQQAEAIAGPDRETMDSVVSALIEELGQIKDNLDIMVRGKSHDLQSLAALVPYIQHISDTMAMVGLQTPRKVLQEQIQNVNDFIANGQEPSDSDMMDIAGALLYVEASLSGLGEHDHGGAPHRMNGAHEAVVNEARNGLEQTKEAITDFIGSHFDLKFLRNIPERLNTIAGGLHMIDQDKASRIILSCARYIQSTLIGEEHSPEWAELDTLADALMGVEYYLERLGHDGSAISDKWLEQSRNSIAQLGFPVDDKSQEFSLNLADGNTEATDTVKAEAEALVTETVEEPEEDQDAAQQVDAVAPEPVVETEPESAIESVPEAEPVADIEPERAAPVVEEVVSATSVETEQEEDDDNLIDDEIIEIFLEEVEEVLEEINTYFPKYASNEQDEDSLTEFRRAFHTLKGSGRMVGASVIGELAWSVENMLNRLIDGTIARTDDLIDVVRRVTDLVPELIEDFKQQNQNETAMVQFLAGKADLLSQGQWEAGKLAEPVADVTAKPVAEVIEEPDQELVSETDVVTESAEADEEGSARSSKQPVDDFEQDSLLSIFRSEMERHLELVENRLDIDFENNGPVKLRDSLQRALHTIQGSAQAANFVDLADTAFAAETMVRDFQSKGILLDAEMAACLGEFVQYFRSRLDHLDAPDDQSADCLKALQVFHQSRIQQLESDQTEPDVMELFMSANMDIILDAEQMVLRWMDQGHSIDDVVRLNKGLHELAVSAERVNLRPIARLSDRLVEFYNRRLLNDDSLVKDADYTLALKAQEQLINMIDRLAAGQSLKFATQVEAELETAMGMSDSNDQFVTDMLSESPETVEQEAEVLAKPVSEAEQLEQIVAQHLEAEMPIPVEVNYIEIQSDPELLEIYLDEAQDIIEEVSGALENWQQQPDDLSHVASLQRQLHTLKGGARMAEISPIADLSHELENLYEGMNLGLIPVEKEVFDLCRSCHEQLSDMIQEVLQAQRCPEAAGWTSRIQSYLHWARNQDGSPSPESLSATESAQPVEALPVADVEEISEAEFVESSEAEAVQTERSGYQWQIELDEDVDTDILDIFIDEAAELLLELDTNIHAWQEEPHNDEYGDALKRVLHTLKGGARLSKLTPLAEFSHDFESFVIKSLREDPTPEAPFFQQVIQRYDELAAGIEQLQQVITGASGDTTGIGESVIAQVQAASADESGGQKESNVVPFTGNKGQGNKPAAPQRGSQPQETVKVGASLLESLVNLAGETSITRSRLEEQVSDFGFTLMEMEATIDRLRDQVRRLDIETEAQVAFTQERAEESNYRDFDPLEMDRYSSMQQLSKSLMEATSDLFDLKSSLTDKTRDAETVLLQQSRINTELHEGLMQTRMVPFSRLTPRLRRIVRQIADETGKKVEFAVLQGEGELDRSVLERMISPLEHILRNAVDHGIESPSVRQAKNKPEAGRIEISVSRQGGEAILQISDDGAGIDVDRVRAKALERGLITADQQVSDQDVLQFILHAGFTTTEKVTQISGRGVGMDVVQSEVRALGGTIAIDTEKDKGTQFNIRLSVNVSVNRALMVRIGEDQYAIPLDSIEGIVRINPRDLDQLLKADADLYEYAGKQYDVRYLGEFLASHHRPNYMTSSLPVPLVLVKSGRGRDAIALHVDSLLGSKEIVVKSLGPQFATVQSLSGATILGDGSVVVILDLASLVQGENLIEARTGTDDAIGLSETPKVSRLPRVLIVDDSVTVRKVTSRLLDRNGYEAKTAKDGADAILTLQEYTPDVILLDIEMPRMDGFEVAARVRHDPRTQNIPIIMITSRTGSKHRERALSIGVDEYLGKPFQEAPLLQKIEHFVTHGRGH